MSKMRFDGKCKDCPDFDHWLSPMHGTPTPVCVIKQWPTNPDDKCDCEEPPMPEQGTRTYDDKAGV